MKKFKLFKMLAVLIVLITSINTAWAATQIDLYVSGAKMFGSAWDYSTSEIRYGYNYNREGQSDGWTGHQEATETMSYTYHSYPVYKCVIWSHTESAQIYFYHYKNGVYQSEHRIGNGWINFKGYNNQLYMGDDDKGNGIFKTSWEPDTEETVTIYYALANTENYTIKANARISGDYETWETVTMTNTGKTYDGKKIYTCDLTLYRGGLQHLEFNRYNGGNFVDKVMPINNSWTGKATFDGKLYYSSSWKTLGEKRSYDGETYIYWKTSGNDIPSGWDTGAGSHQIQLLKITDGNYVYSGFQTGEDLGGGYIRYLVPEGSYADVAEVKGKNGNCSGEFGFPSENEKNLIYNYTNQGKWGSWSTAYFVKNAYIYMDNTASKWPTEDGEGDNRILIGRAVTSVYSNTYDMESIDNTNLLCYPSSFTFADYNQICFIHTEEGQSWGESTTQSPGERKVGAQYHTDQVAYLMDGGSKLYNLFTPDGPGSGSSYPQPSHESASTYAGLLHSTQQVYTVAKTTGAYSEVNSKAEISLSSFKLNSAKTTTASEATLSTSESTDEITAVRTATTTLTCSNTIAEGYQFDGWYDAANGGTRLQSAKSYSYATTGATDVYARFSAMSYTITLNDGSGSGGDGTHSVTYDAAVGTLSSAPTRSNYVFCGYETSDHVKIFNANLTAVSNVDSYTDGGNWIKADNVTLYAIWEDQWAIKGEGGSLGNWDIYTGIPNTGTNTFEKEIELQKGTTYTFKIISRNRLSDSDTWYGNTSGSGLITITRNESGDAQSLSTGGGESDNIQIEPDVTGNYIFSVNNSSGVTLTITYPASHTITFGAGDINGSSTAITASASPSFSSGEYVLDATSVTFSKGSTVEGYDWKGWYSNSDGTGTLHSSTDGSYTNSSRSANLTVYACYTYHQYDIIYKDQGNVAYSGSNEALLPDKHEYNTATVLVNGVKSYYSFGGWYDNEDCTGTAVTTLGATDHTTDITLYAKWTQTVILDKNGTNSEYRSDGSLTATYNNAGPFAITTAPVRVGYSVEGYYAEPECTHKVMTAAGALVNYTGYVEGGKWVHAGATILYTKWTPDYFVIYRSGDMDGESRTTSDAVYSYEGGTISKPIEYRMKVSELNKWYTLCLPFVVNAVKVWGGTEYLSIYPCHRPSKDAALRQGYYVIRTPDSEEKSGSSVQIELNNFGDWVDPFYYDGYVPSANTPYIIQWNMDYFNGKYISFFGDANQTIPNAMSGVDAPTDEYIKICGNNSMTNGSVAGVYLLDNDYGAGAWLRAEDVEEVRTIHPFECYLIASESTTANNMVIKRRTGEDSATGWEEILNYERKDVITVYTITGYKVAQYENCSFDEAGRRMNGDLSEGIYIMNAGNESVKLIIR